MLERPQVRAAVVGQPGERPDPLLGVLELTVALPQERDAALVAGERVFEAGVAVFEVAEDALEFGERLFEPDGFGVGRGHDRIPCG